LASIAAVIPAMDKLDVHLKPGTQEPYHPAIQVAMKLACKKINQYYSMTDLSSAYRIAMSKKFVHFMVKYSHLNQSFIRGSNSNTSDKKNGKMSGLMRQKISYAEYTLLNMREKRK